MELETVIGLEIHVQLKTKSKMFCSCDNNADDVAPNTHVCPVCLAHPGTLPVPNRQAIDWSVLSSLALNCAVDPISKFDRKHYFYPDLPKGYQISQYDQPFGHAGFLDIIDESKEQGKHRVRINRLHLEEDAAKLTHVDGATLIDFNRAGTPLMEIVTEPDISSPAQARVFLQSLRMIIRYLGVSDADMEKGHLRCDANISLRPVGDTKLYPKTEIKNVNSFKAVEKALLYELKRQTKLWQAKNPPAETTTRGWSEKRQQTEEQRTKEGAMDYRYFPEPDIPPITFTADQLDAFKAQLPELPQVKLERFQNEFGFKSSVAGLLVADRYLASYVEAVMSEASALIEFPADEDGSEQKTSGQAKVAKLVGNWITTELFKLLAEHSLTIETCPVTPEHFAHFISIVFAGKLNSSQAQTLLLEMFKTKRDPEQIIQDQDLTALDSTDELQSVIDKVVAANAKSVAEYKKGKQTAVMYLVGQVMKATKGKANPQTARELLEEALKR